MIRYSVQSDLNGIISLWKEAFGDSETEIKFFLNNRYKPENTLLAEEDGEITSMLFLLEGEMTFEGKCYPSYYLYAACTLNKYRGRGYMASLLDFAKETAFNRGYYFICLLPGEKSLYDFYEKHGYKTVFKKKILKINSDSIKDNPQFRKESICEIEKIRNKAFRNFNVFKWDCDALKFAFEHHEFFGGKALFDREGYALYTTSDGDIVVKEIAFTGDINSILSCIVDSEKDINELYVYLPVDFETTFSDYEIIDSGMMLPVNIDAEKITNRITNAYLGLTLD